jgi:CDP-glycerol glycerophosphotransferase (TagB/SpsB family)
MWKRFDCLYRSRYIIDSNAYIHKRRKGQIRLHLGHGMLMKITPDYHRPDKIGDCDGFLITSPFWADVFAEKIGLDRNCLLPLGYPRNDVFADKTKERNRFGRYLMWLPTYRQHRLHPEQAVGECFPYGMPEVETKEQLLKLDEYLQEQGLHLYFRAHPVQDLSGLKKEKLSHIELADDRFLAENNISLYEMLAGAQGLITDYSSVYYDFLLTERPIGLTIRDSAEYFAHYGCPFDNLKENVQGFYIECYEDVLAFVENVGTGHLDGQENLGRLKERYHSFADGKASERIYRYMEEKSAEYRRIW